MINVSKKKLHLRWFLARLDACTRQSIIKVFHKSGKDDSLINLTNIDGIIVISHLSIN